MPWTHHDLLTDITTHLKANLSGVSQYRYAGPLSPISDESDFKNFSPGLFPLLGVALYDLNYEDASMENINPITGLVFTVAFRQTGARPQDESETFYEATQALQTYLLGQQASASAPFGQNVIQAMRVLRLATSPSFTGKVDSNRKGFAVAEFPVELFMETL